MCVCVCVCVCVCPAPRVLPLRTTERPTEGTYTASAQSGKHFKYGVFSLCYGVKANKLSMCLPRHHMAPMERYFGRKFEDRAFSGSFKV